MYTLVAIHTDLVDLDGGRKGHFYGIRRLERRISEEIHEYLRRRDRVYHLASVGSDRKFLYPVVALHASRKPYIPRNPSIERQFLRAKELLIEERAQRVFACGVTWKCCVNSFYHLLLGEATDDDPIDSYECEIGPLRWTRRKFNRIFQYRFDAEILEHLTDKI
ncbi:MAG: hypothetical protein HY514_00665 [Candidatus Aenigmarchaeota archaeon]|nr:hypothetical protein [Candidatus Aenigmarchaeota archaeon]